MLTSDLVVFMLISILRIESFVRVRVLNKSLLITVFPVFTVKQLLVMCSNKHLRHIQL